MKRPPAPTPSELRILKCLWANGPSTVREVHEHIAADTAVSYTTTLKQMQIMHSKGLLERDDSQRAHVFSAVPEQEQTQRAMLSDFVERVYEGSASQMVLQALGMSEPASADELAEMDHLIRRLRESGDNDNNGESED